MENQTCCPPGSHGRAASHYTEAKGQMETWNLNGKDVETYTVGDKESNTVVIFVHDIFGIHEGRVKACCDFLAENGCRVIFPDWHMGDDLVITEDFMSKFKDWADRHPLDEVSKMVAETADKVRGQGKKIVTIGFCWGTWVLYHAQKHQIKMDGCVCMHPSLGAEALYGRNYADLLKAQNCPVMVAAASNDAEWSKPGSEWEETSKSLGFGEKSKFYLFQDMVHGWANRGDVKNELVARDVDLALKHALDFINSL